jgi:hypothetical protein
VQPPCDTASFDAAWNLIPIGLGGTLTFNCGAAPVSINMSGTKTITKQVTIDGGGNIVLSGDNKHRHFVVNAGAALTLTNITIAAGRGNLDSDAGGAVQNFGTLTVLSSTFRLNRTGPSYGGGAIYSRGRLIMDNSTIIQNTAGAGGAIYNEKVGGSQGNAVINNTQIVSNTAYGSHSGAGIFNIARLEMNHVTIAGNRSTSNGQGYGAGIYNDGVLIFRDGTVSMNGVSAFGGGIHNRGLMDLTRVRIENNRATSGGGVHAEWLTNNDYYYLCDSYLRAVTLHENVASEKGGGIASNIRCSLVINDSTISANAASEGGGVWFNEPVWALRHRWRNTTIARNTASNNGGGIFIFNPADLTLTNVTLMENQATAGQGGGLYANSAIKLVNTIIASSPAGGNCAGSATLSAAYSLSSDNTCVFSGAGNKLNTDPLLNPLGDYGGPTLTYLPKAGSPAIDSVIGSNAPTTDQRGLPRPVGAGYDIGAVERQPSDDTVTLTPRIRIPIVLR